MRPENELLSQLDSFSPDVRRAALRGLVNDHLDALAAPGTNVNMHCHSFFSYNANSWSPSRIAWEARKAGLYAAGLCDFDVLDGRKEFLGAAEAVGLRATVNLETRSFVSALADADINSPGEPGVSYVMGAGFAKPIDPGSPQGQGLATYRRSARERNEALISRINPHIPDIALDYEKDVLPLTPAGVATERHIVQAYVDKAEAVFPDETKRAEFWAIVLESDYEGALALLSNRVATEEKVRSRLAKRGGIGYAQPSVDTFPAIRTFMTWVASCDAIPTATWLDGTSAGEADPQALLGVMRDAGASALNIIPDRNWNIADADTKAVKVANLNAVVEEANGLNMPINIGTELNKAGLPFVDDLAVPELALHRETFLQGACVMVGHMLLARYADMPYGGDRAAAELPDPPARNAFFASVGAMPAVTENTAADLKQIGPEKALNWIMDHRETT